MSQLPPSRVYQGFWIDHSKGNVLGSTITTNSTTANVVVAILSILIAFAGANLWDVIAYVLFTIRATNLPRNGLHHQQQILLRNIASPASIFFKALRLQTQSQWHRKSLRREKSTRLLLIAAIAAFCSIGFLVAGVVSSLVTSSDGIEVLANSAYCGFEDRVSPELDDSGIQLSGSYDNKATEDSVRYARQCYNSSLSNSACQVYVTQAIPFSTTYDTCPFDGICLMNDNQALKMDTGLMNSNEIFGINVRPGSALGMRKVTTCSPLNLSRYQRTEPMDDIHAQAGWRRAPLAEEYMIAWDLGPWPFQPYNETVYASSAKKNTTVTYGSGVAPWHKDPLSRFQQTPWAHGWGFNPIDVFLSTEADLAVVAIDPNSIAYIAPIDDPIFAAHVPKQWTVSNGEVNRNVTLYTADAAVSFIGCTEQHQFCTPQGQCTDLTYSVTAAEQAALLNLDAIQNVTLYMFVNALINYSAGLFSLNLAAGVPFLATEGTTGNNHQQLPPNQWELEVKFWHSIVLSIYQRLIADFAAGQGTMGDQYDTLRKSPPSPYESTLCHAQKMKAPNNFSNISVFGLSFTVAVSGMIILINLVLPPTLKWLSRSLGKQWVFVERWERDEILQFQRAAYESHGIGTWSNNIHKVPFVTTDEQFRCLSAQLTNQPAKASITSSNSSGGETASRENKQTSVSAEGETRVQSETHPHGQSESQEQVQNQDSNASSNNVQSKDV